MTTRTKKRNIETIYALSPMQQGMLFHSLLAPNSGAYHEQMICTIDGPLHTSAFEQAWQAVIDRHAVLRTSFVWKQLDKTLQVIHRQVSASLEQHDLRDLATPEQEAYLKRFLAQDRETGFDLASPPLLRLNLFRIGMDQYRFVWSLHHLLLDGWSMPIILQEVLAFYEAYSHGRSIELESCRPFRDYIAWLQQQDMQEAKLFWQNALKGFAAPTPLVVDSPPKALSEEIKTYPKKSIRLSEEMTETLHAMARENHLTLNTIMQGVWALLLSRYSGEKDVLFGATVSGRPAELTGVESMIGLFINTIPIRARVTADLTAVEWLQALQDQVAETRQYEYAPLVEIQDWSEIPHNVGLFESLLVFENYPVSRAAQADQRTLQIRDIQAIEQTNYPLTVVSGPGEKMSIEICYEQQRFDGPTIDRMLGHLKNLLESIAITPHGQLSRLPLLSAPEEQQMLIDWNATDTDLEFTCIHRLFEAQVQRTPDNTALVFEDQSLSYRELNARANQLARALRDRGVGPETLVAVCVERSLEMIVAILGVLKAGGAYLPLDPSYPDERISFMLGDSGAWLLITQDHLLAHLPQGVADVYSLDTERETMTRYSGENLDDDVAPDSLAYVIYTSGSTGKPKGVALEHRSVCNLIPCLISRFELAPGSRFLQFASLSFDASVAEILAPLSSGATLYLAPRETLLSMPALTQLLQQEAITTMVLPPSLLAILEPEGLENVTTVVSAGEACSVEIARRWSPGRTFLNGYGPTENTVATSLYRVESLDKEATNVPIGRPIANVKLYLLDPHLQPVPIGVPGELYIGGAGLARGYLNRSELTAERFIPNPFDPEPGARLYKTGDRVRYLPSGNIEFMGRIDRQVKIRGFRIELGEIEALLSLHPSVRNAAVLAREDTPGVKYLAAYVTPRDDREPDPAALRHYLAAKLPDFMVPTAFALLPEMPLTPAGKVDRRALPAPDNTRPVMGTAYAPPRTPTEKALADIWQQILGIVQLGIHDNFFEMGGHSLLATQVMSRILKTWDIELPLRALFDAPTVSALSGQIDEALRTATHVQMPPIVPTPREGPLPLSFAQQRLWFLDQLAPGNLFYNIPIAVRLDGSLDVNILRKSLNEIVRRHEVLRTAFRLVDGVPTQHIRPKVIIDLPVIDLSAIPEQERQAEADRLILEESQRSFDLGNDVLVRGCLIALDDETHIAALTLHHIIADGWSMDILIRELAQLYDAFLRGDPSPLPKLALQYADLSAWQHNWLEGEILERQLDYWKETLGSQPPQLDLPTDHPRPAVQSWNGDTVDFAVPAALAHELRALGQKEGTTLFMSVLAGFQTLLYRYTNQTEISVGTPIANRNHAEVEGLIGLLINTLVMKTSLDGELGFRQVLRRVRETALGAYAHQDIPFEMLVDALQPERTLDHTPLFQVAIGLQNKSHEAVNLPGLTISPIPVHTKTAKFDLTLLMAEEQEGLLGTLEYNTDLFERTTIERMARHLLTLLESCVASPDQPIAQAALLSEEEQQQLLVAWNATNKPAPTDRCVHELFETHVAQQPDAVALTYEGQEISYRDLDQRANRLAHYLQKRGVGPEVLVGILTERGPDMIVAILGALKAGGAYLPLDPTYPRDRLAFMLADSRIPVLLSLQHLTDRLPEHEIPTVYLDRDWPLIAKESANKPTSQVGSDNLAYVIYTSGSTGRPKGAMLRHRGLCNLTQVQRRAFHITPDSRVLQFSPFSFDASVWETFMALANGATLCLAPQEVLASGPELVRLIRDVGVTHVTLPPSMLHVLPDEPLPSLQTIISAGEACTAELVARWAPGRAFFNAYGPTETTVCASMYLCDPQDPLAPPIGRPIDNCQLYVLDPHMQPVPVGVPGELHIGGVNVARGYYNRPDLTAAKFVPDPFSSDPQARLYKTGDLVRYGSDGNISFLGRIDHQVKIRGFRIELGEVESVLRQHDAIKECVALAREDTPGDKRLVAYIVPTEETELNSADVRDHLRERLPEYMVPTAYVFLDALPLTPNGKVDRRALPAPTLERADLQNVFVAPQSPIEKQLAQICEELLGVERVGIHDSFFELGGHSLLATQFISHVRDKLQVELPLRAVFETPTVSGLAKRIAAQRQADMVDVDAIMKAIHQVESLPAEQILWKLKEPPKPLEHQNDAVTRTKTRDV